MIVIITNCTFYYVAVDMFKEEMTHYTTGAEVSTCMHEYE